VNDAMLVGKGERARDVAQNRDRVTVGMRPAASRARSEAPSMNGIV